jgi:cytochrome c biogenesis protein CcdA
LQLVIEQLFVKLSRFTPKTKKSSGFIGGLVIGVSLGLIWTPCVGPLLASVITLAISGTVTGSAAIITLAYAIGTAIPMLAIIYGGQRLMQRVPWLLNNTVKIQKAFGVLMVLTALAIYFNVDRNFQAYVLKKIPQYSEKITMIEDIPMVKERLNILQNR